jgi:hypothetical protein
MVFLFFYTGQVFFQCPCSLIRENDFYMVLQAYNIISINLFFSHMVIGIKVQLSKWNKMFQYGYVAMAHSGGNLNILHHLVASTFCRGARSIFGGIEFPC